MTMNRSALNLAYLTQIRKAIAVMQRGKNNEPLKTDRLDALHGVCSGFDLCDCLMGR